MAPRKFDQAVEKQGKIKFMFFELEGNDATLQDAIRSINGIVNRTVIGNGSAQRRVLASAAPAPLSNGQGEPVAEDEAIEVDLLEEEEDDATQRRAARTPRKGVTPPTAIPFDMETAVSLKDYVAQYKLETDQDRYLALAGWLKAHRAGAPLKAGLILTLYGHMDWKTQVDVTMPLRRLSTKKMQWLERTGAGEYQIATLGESKLSKLKVA
jgi:hypothetical protein